tara:strand:- start:276 stop:392 length:117 start_codon:yes stop_codon:yes gene_type:complete
MNMKQRINFLLKKYEEKKIIRIIYPKQTFLDDFQPFFA